MAHEKSPTIACRALCKGWYIFIFQIYYLVIRCYILIFYTHFVFLSNE